jgi:AraC-like DNA-binding protein
MESFNKYKYKETFDTQIVVKHKVSAVDWMRNSHIHDDFELMLVLSDDIRCMVGDSVYPAPKNTLLIFNNMDLHYMGLNRPAGIPERYVLYFKPEFISSFSSVQTDLLECFFFRPFQDPFLLPLTETKAAELIALFEDLIKSCAAVKENDYGDDLQIKMLLTRLLIKVNQSYRLEHGIHTDSIGKDYSRIYQLINYLHRNYANDISLDILAQQFFINKFYLCNVFKKVTGMSINQYLINCRLMKAKELLLKNYSVDEVCDLTGYNNLSHFSRSFKQHTGRSPKQYQLGGLPTAP